MIILMKMIASDPRMAVRVERTLGGRGRLSSPRERTGICRVPEALHKHDIPVGSTRNSPGLHKTPLGPVLSLLSHDVAGRQGGGRKRDTGEGREEKDSDAGEGDDGQGLPEVRRECCLYLRPRARPPRYPVLYWCSRRHLCSTGQCSGLFCLFLDLF